MSIIDDAIVNIRRIAGDIQVGPERFVEEFQGTVGGVFGTALQIAQPLAGQLGPAGPIGVTNGGDPGDIDPEKFIINPGGLPVRDLSTFRGGNWSGGNGQFATRTTVERLEIANGQVTITSQSPGSPHLMNSDIQAAKKVFRNVAKLNRRLPRKTVKESPVSKLKDAAVEAAIRRANTDDCCPPKC